MPIALEDLKAELAGLTEQERAELAHFLIETLDNANADGDIEAAWDAELTRRADEIQRGTAVGKPSDQVFVESRQKHS
jgi:putative addiction module component (TIGR02574 family)